MVREHFFHDAGFVQVVSAHEFFSRARFMDVFAVHRPIGHASSAGYVKYFCFDSDTKGEYTCSARMDAFGNMHIAAEPDLKYGITRDLFFRKETSIHPVKDSLCLIGHVYDDVADSVEVVDSYMIPFFHRRKGLHWLHFSNVETYIDAHHVEYECECTCDNLHVQLRDVGDKSIFDIVDCFASEIK